MTTDINPFEDKNIKTSELSTQVSQESKSVAAIQAAFIIAKKFPRNEHSCYISIIESCKRPSFAEQCCYAYPRGGQLITGASIRLAEVLAQKWGNCQVGIEIVSQDSDRTEARAFANDLETNYAVEASFTVKHVRFSKKGVTKLTDERDIREMVANIGSRYLRGCILRIIPKDIVEAAIAQSKKTLESGEVPISERIRLMVGKFDELGVKVEHLEKRLMHKLEATIPEEIVSLQHIYKSIKDGFAKREDFFEIKMAESKADLTALIDAKKTKEAKGDLINDDKNQL